MRSATIPIKGGKLPAVTDTEPWDGKDGQVQYCLLTSLRLYLVCSCL